MPTIGSLYTNEMRIYRDLLSKEIEKAVWWKSKWTPFIGLLDYDKFKKQNPFSSPATMLRPTGNVIDVAKEFMNYGSVTMDIPIVYPLVGKGVRGTAQLEGNEETRKIATKKVRINQIRHAVVIQDNKMSKQVLKKPEVVMALMERGANDLKDWFSRWMAVQPYFALLTGYSEHLTDPIYGVNVTMKSHPNLYVQGLGKVSTTGFGTSTYEQAVKTALSSLSDTSGDYFGATSIENMVYLARRHRIQPLKLGGQEVYVIFIHSAQALQLMRDPEFTEPVKFAWERGKDNPLFTGVVEGMIWKGALIIIDDTIPPAFIYGDSEFDASKSTTGDNNGVMYFNRDTFMANPVVSGARRPAILVGQGAITCGYASELSFETREADYSQFISDGADMIVGFERADIYDDDGYFGQAGAFLENTSSLVYFTYSPDNITI